MPELPVIVNASAGKGYGSAECDALCEAFRAAGVEPRVLHARGGGEVLELAKKAVASGAPTLVAAGGDGTVSTVASAIVGTPVALGIVPLGTLNHFARDVGIPLDLDGAVRVIVANRPIQVDAGEVNGRPFINNSSIGLYPTLVLHRNEQQRRLGRGKWHALFWAAMSVLRRHPMLDVRLSLDQDAARRRTPFVFIGNNEYRMEGFQIGTRGRLDAGVLSVYITQRHGRRGLLGLAFRALFGRLPQSRDFEALTAHTVGIETRHPRLPVATDGEVTMMDMPLEYRVRRGALRLIVPAPAST